MDAVVGIRRGPLRRGLAIDSNVDIFTYYVFFFSSRRRHTRCSRDWSSDVCSSDLVPYAGFPPEGCVRFPASRPPPPGGLETKFETNQEPEEGQRSFSNQHHAPGPAVQHRSEEHTSELQSRLHLVCRLLLEKKKKTTSH